MRGAFLLCTVAASVAGCAVLAPPPGFSLLNNQQVYMQDQNDCIKQSAKPLSEALNNNAGSASSTTMPSRSVFMNCMAAKGHQVDPNVPLVTSEESKVQMVQ